MCIKLNFVSIQFAFSFFFKKKKNSFFGYRVHSLHFSDLLFNLLLIHLFALIFLIGKCILLIVPVP